jgi:hypothetical protein
MSALAHAMRGLLCEALDVPFTAVNSPRLTRAIVEAAIERRLEDSGLVPSSRSAHDARESCRWLG